MLIEPRQKCKFHYSTYLIRSSVNHVICRYFNAVWFLYTVIVIFILLYYKLDWCIPQYCKYSLWHRASYIVLHSELGWYTLHNDRSSLWHHA